MRARRRTGLPGRGSEPKTANRHHSPDPWLQLVPRHCNIHLLECNRFFSLQEDAPHISAAINVSYDLKAARTSVVDAHAGDRRGGSREQRAALTVGEFESPRQRRVPGCLFAGFRRQRLRERQQNHIRRPRSTGRARQLLLISHDSLVTGIENAVARRTAPRVRTAGRRNRRGKAGSVQLFRDCYANTQSCRPERRQKLDLGASWSRVCGASRPACCQECSKRRNRQHAFQSHTSPPKRKRTQRRIRRRMRTFPKQPGS